MPVWPCRNSGARINESASCAIRQLGTRVPLIDRRPPVASAPAGSTLALNAKVHARV